MIKAFDIAGYGVDVIKDKFSALFNAFHYGTPPHAGVAPGFDVILMLIADTPNIREVTAFPMNSKAQDLLMQAPNTISDKLIKEWEKSEAERELSLKDSIKINKMVHKFGIGIMENIDRWGDWKDRHGAYQNDEGEWEV